MKVPHSIRLIAPCLVGIALGAMQALAAAAPAIKGKGAFTEVVEAAALASPTARRPADQLGPLSPAESATSFHVDAGLVWEQVLAEPLVAQPLFVAFDERSRLWVVEYRQYPHPAGLKMVSRDNFWRAVYDKVPPPPPNHFKGADRISIHEDTNGDGTYDKHTTFVDGLSIATSVAFGRGGVFVLNPPYLLFYPDRNRDDVPDGDPQVLLSGLGLEDTHSVANSLRWGPDGWLYACQGSTVTANIIVYGADGKPLNAKPFFSQGQNIWRYHPEKRIYEVFSEGGGNAFGLEIDSVGRIFSGHNGGNTRGFHYQQGAYLQKGFDKHGPLSNPYAFGYFPQMPHNDADRFTHNFLIYDSGALGEKYTGRLFGVEPLQGRVVMSEFTADGSSFRTRDLGFPVTSDDKWFRPVDIKLGPDGALYVCDWYDRQVNHYRNHEGQMDASNGRIYRLRAKSLPASATQLPKVDLGTWQPDQLASLLVHPNRWVRQTALRLIADRPEKLRELDISEIQQRSGGQTALEALWALHLAGRLDDTLASQVLHRGNAPMRAWTVRLLGDNKAVSPVMAKSLAELAAREPDVEVRAQLASTAKRLPTADALAIVKELMTHDKDTGDARQPLLIWWAIEDKCATDREAVLALMRDRELWDSPLVQGHLLSRLMRRFAATGRREDLLTCARLFQMSPGPIQTARLTQGFEEAYKGRPLVALPEELLTAMERAGGESVLIGARRGKPASVASALATIQDRAGDASRRLQLIQVFGEARQATAVPVLLAIVRDDKNVELRRAALSALQSYEDPGIATEVVSQLGAFPGELRAGAFSLLASRPAWATALLWSVEGGQTPKAAVPADVVRRIQKLGGAPITDLLARLWPSLRQPTSAELEKEIARLTGVIEASTGSPYSGKKLFLENCGVCHKLFNVGAQIGPDLTIYKRDDLANILLNVVNPNAEIREGYENFTIETKDGRTLSGFLADKDAQVVVLRGADGQSVAVPRAEIATMQPAGASLMPEGLLSSLSDQQVRDLFAFLRSTQPLPE